MGGLKETAGHSVRENRGIKESFFPSLSAIPPFTQPTANCVAPGPVAALPPPAPPFTAPPVSRLQLRPKDILLIQVFSALVCPCFPFTGILALVSFLQINFLAIFRCDYASLLEVVSVGSSFGPSVGPSVGPCVPRYFQTTNMVILGDNKPGRAIRCVRSAKSGLDTIS